jgi:hypothetical protein
LPSDQENGVASQSFPSGLAGAAKVLSVILGAALFAYVIWLIRPGIGNDRSVYTALIVLSVSVAGAPVAFFSLSQFARATETVGAFRAEYEVATRLSEEAAAIAHRIRHEESNPAQRESDSLLSAPSLTAPTLGWDIVNIPQGVAVRVGHGT